MTELLDVVKVVKREKGALPVMRIAQMVDDGIKRIVVEEVKQDQVIWPKGAPGRGEMGRDVRVWLKVEGDDYFVVGADGVSRRVTEDILAALRVNYDALGDEGTSF